MTFSSTGLRPEPHTKRWQLSANCREQDSALFFNPEGERGPTRDRRDDAAKAICLGCPVLRDCRAHALAIDGLHGVWGGMSRADRDDLKLLHVGVNEASALAQRPPSSKGSSPFR